MSTTRDERKQLFELKNKIEIAIKNNENDKEMLNLGFFMFNSNFI